MRGGVPVARRIAIAVAVALALPIGIASLNEAPAQCSVRATTTPRVVRTKGLTVVSADPTVKTIAVAVYARALRRVPVIQAKASSRRPWRIVRTGTPRRTGDHWVIPLVRPARVVWVGVRGVGRTRIRLITESGAACSPAPVIGSVSSGPETPVDGSRSRIAGISANDVIEVPTPVWLQGTFAAHVRVDGATLTPTSGKYVIDPADIAPGEHVLVVRDTGADEIVAQIPFLVPTWPAPAATRDESSLATGVGINGADGTAAGVGKSLAAMASAGARWVRVDFSWSGVQPTDPTSWNWATLDATVAGGQAAGVHILPIVGYAPGWAADPRCASATCRPDPSHFDDWEAFVRAAAARYRGKITYWEVWNEPNLNQFFSPAADAGVYADLLHRAARAVRSSDPAARVLMGGLASVGNESGFLAGIYAAGGKDDFDAMNLHPYSWQRPPDFTAGPGDVWFDSMGGIRAVMHANGDDAKRVWVTEFGATVIPTPDPRGTTEQMQYAIGKAGLTQWRRLPWSGPLMFYTWADPCPNLMNAECWFGLKRANGTERPAFALLSS